jgi:hypothetical protein
VGEVGACEGCGYGVMAGVELSALGEGAERPGFIVEEHARWPFQKEARVR